MIRSGAGYFTCDKCKDNFYGVLSYNLCPSCYEKFAERLVDDGFTYKGKAGNIKYFSKEAAIQHFIGEKEE